MADTTIGIIMKGVDSATATIQKVAGQLNQLGKAGAGGAGAGFHKLLDSGAKMATQSLGQLGGAITSLGPLGIATGAILASAIKRYNYEVEQNIKAIKEQAQALKSMADAADATNARIEKRLNLEKQLRSLQDDIDDADPVRRAQTQLANTDAEIEAVKREIEEVKGVKSFALRESAANLDAVEDVRAGHAVWWETGTEKANKERYDAAEKARATAKKMAEKQLELEQKLVVLAKQRELAETNIGRAKQKVEQDAAATIQKQADEEKRTKEKADAEVAKRADEERKASVKALQERKQGLLEQLRLMERMSDGPVNAGVFSGGSHTTNLLLDKLRGANEDATTNEVRANVKSIYQTLKDIDAQMSKLGVA